MKDIILENLSMIDILDKYNIKRKGSQFVCPFHKDKNPSAKAYKNSYFCFACGKTGDLIQFVEDYYNVDFKTAMKTINNDFNLGLSYKINQKQLDEIKKARKNKEKQKMQYNNQIIQLCDKIKELEKKYNHLKSKIHPYNWEEIEYECSIILQEIEKLNCKFDELYIKSPY